MMVIVVFAENMATDFETATRTQITYKKEATQRREAKGRRAGVPRGKVAAEDGATEAMEAKGGETAKDGEAKVGKQKARAKETP